MAKWFEIFKQGIMNNIQVLFEQSEIDFDVRQRVIEVQSPKSKETIISEALKVFYAIGNADYKILIAHPREEQFLFYEQRKIGHVEMRSTRTGDHPSFVWESRASSDAEAVQIVNRKIREIEEKVRGR